MLLISFLIQCIIVASVTIIYSYSNAKATRCFGDPRAWDYGPHCLGLEGTPGHVRDLD